MKLCAPRTPVLRSLVLCAAAVLPALPAIPAIPALAGGVKDKDKDKEWAEGVPYLTDWKAAIKEASNTGKILFIYNGWQREKV
jgi:hypothetical protein